MNVANFLQNVCLVPRFIRACIRTAIAMSLAINVRLMQHTLLHCCWHLLEKPFVPTYSTMGHATLLLGLRYGCSSVVILRRKCLCANMLDLSFKKDEAPSVSQQESS